MKKKNNNNNHKEDDDNDSAVQYEANKAYTQVGNEWYSLDDLMVKKDVLKLIKLMKGYISLMAKFEGNIGEPASKIFLQRLDELKKEIDGKQ
jgi:hypothetical protein